MIVKRTFEYIPGVRVIEFERFTDFRGYFTETFRLSDLKTVLPQINSIVQGNESFSNANVFRGLHLQWKPYMGKLVRLIEGEMIDLFLDIRKGSPTFGQIRAHFLTPLTEWIYLPPGIAHGCYFISPSRIEYLCTGEYNQKTEGCISIYSNLDWNFCNPKAREFLTKDFTISDKDREALSLAEWTQDKRSDNFIYGEC
jgi:dTDP-4-dehydrorhamnose 3,5-epimerase